MSRPIEDQVQSAQRHIELGRAIIEYHKELLERRRAEGGDTKPVEDLLAALEHSQKVFERDLAELERPSG
jgi:hypothetical protein